MTPKHFSNRFRFYTIYLRKITQKNLEKKRELCAPSCPQVCRNTQPNIGRNRRNRETHVQKNIQFVYYTIKKRGHIVNPYIYRKAGIIFGYSDSPIAFFENPRLEFPSDLSSRLFGPKNRDQIRLNSKIWAPKFAERKKLVRIYPAIQILLSGRSGRGFYSAARIAVSGQPGTFLTHSPPQ